MTNNCIVEVLKLQEENGIFADLTVEQLLYAAVKGTDKEDVLWVLMNTDWDDPTEENKK